MKLIDLQPFDQKRIKFSKKTLKVGGDMKTKGVYYGICQAFSTLSHQDTLDLP